ncbi:MAG: hypothetical protein KAS67_05970 [Thermoplasmata archaeon]|nr:hypothetical protein [Thermoplasmata archaeon]
MAKSVNIRVIIDTNIFFLSIFFPDGNERRLFELADRGLWQIIIIDYVFEEMQLVLERKGIEPNLAVDMLDTYRNIIHMDLDPEVYHNYVKEASEIVKDRKDWPIYIFTRIETEKDDETYLVSGDKHLNTSRVKKALNNRALTTKELFKLLRVK